MDGNESILDATEFTKLFICEEGSMDDETADTTSSIRKCIKRTVFHYQMISFSIIPESVAASITRWEFGDDDTDSLYLVIPQSNSTVNPVIMTEPAFRDLFTPLRDSANCCIERRLYECRQKQDVRCLESVSDNIDTDWVVVGCGDILMCHNLKEAQSEKTQILSSAAFYEQFEIVRSCYLDPSVKSGGSARHLENQSSISYADMTCSILDVVSSDFAELNSRVIDVPYLGLVHKQLYRNPSPTSSPQRTFNTHTSEKDILLPSANPTRRLSQTLRPSGSPSFLRQRSLSSRKIVERSITAPTLELDASEMRESSIYSNAGVATLFDLADVYGDEYRSVRSDDARSKRNSRRPESAGSSRTTPTLEIANASSGPTSPITHLGSFFDSASRRNIHINDSNSTGLDNKRQNLAWAGYLEKKGGRGMKSNWKKRWFELDKNNLAAGFVYYDCMPPGTKFLRSDNGEWEFAGAADMSALSTTAERGPLGSVPLLCCVVKNIVASNGEAVMSLHQQVLGGSKNLKLGLSKYIGYKQTHTVASAKSAKSPDRGRIVKRKSMVDVERSANSTSPPRSAQTYRRRSSMGGRVVESSSLSPPPSSRGKDLSRESSDDESPLTEYESLLHMENVGRTFFIKMDGNFGVRGGLEQLLREASIYVTLSVFHGACGYSVRASGYDGQAAVEHREKAAVLVKNCLIFLLNTYGGSVRFIMERLPSYGGKMAMGINLDKNPTSPNDKETMESAIQNSDNKASKLPLHAAARAMNSAVLSILTGHDYIAKPVQSETAVPSFFSRVLNRARAHSNVEGNDESVLSHVDWTVVDAFHPDDSGNTPLHILLKTASVYRESGFVSGTWTSADDDEAVRCMRVLLETSPSVVNACNGDDKTPLHFTAKLPPLYALTLIDARGSITDEDAQGVSPFSEWARCGNYEVLSHVLDLMDEKPEAVIFPKPKSEEILYDSMESVVDARNWMDGSTSIYMAIHGGHHMALSILIQQGRANVNVRDFNWNTPLIFCAKILVAKISQNPYAAVEISATYHECFMILLASGADVNARNIKGKNCLHVLSRIEPIANSAHLVMEPTFRALLKAGVETNVVSYSGYQCIHYAAAMGNWRLLELLFEPLDFPLARENRADSIVCTSRTGVGIFRKIDPNAKGPDGNTALDYAERELKRTTGSDNDNDLRATIQFLLAHGAYRRVSLEVPVERDDYDIKFMSSGSGTYMLKAGTLRRVVERLTAYPRLFISSAEDDRLCFFIQYEKFCTASELMGLLKGRLLMLTSANSVVNGDLASVTVMEGAAEVLSFFSQWYSVRFNVIKNMWSKGDDPSSDLELIEFCTQLQEFVSIFLHAMNKHSFAASSLCKLDTSTAESLISCLLSELRISENDTKCPYSLDDVEHMMHALRQLFGMVDSTVSGRDGGHMLVYDQSLGELYASSACTAVAISSAEENIMSRPSLSYMPLMDTSHFAESGLTSNPVASITYSTLHAIIKSSIHPILVSADASSVVFSCNLHTRRESLSMAARTIWGLSPVQMAQQLTLIMHCLLCFIPPQEFINKEFKDPLRTPHFHLIKETSKRVAFAFASEVLIHSDEKERAHMILFLIHTAECCCRVRNLEGTVAIMTCLEMTAIFRLKRTWAVVEELAPGRWLSLKTFVGTGGRNLDTKYQSMQSPCVPAIGTTLRHIINISEEPTFLKGDRSIANKSSPAMLSNKLTRSLSSYSIDDSKPIRLLTSARSMNRMVGKEPTPDLINFNKLRKFGKVIKTIHMATTALYPFQIMSKITDRLFPPAIDTGAESVSGQSTHRDADICSEGTTNSTALFAFGSEDECYARSIELERKAEVKLTTVG